MGNNSQLQITSYLCIDSSLGRVADASDDDAPLLKVEFCNEANRLDDKQKLAFLQMVQRDLARCLRMWG